jgi:diaminopimelate epimerase
MTRRYAPFAKYEGLGNDFVVVGAADEGEIAVSDARAMCDRRRGIGADGVLVVLPPLGRGSAARMKVINADGSVPEMCGNGLRCVALHLARARKITSGEIVIDTDSGAHACAVEDSPAGADVTVDMGVVQVMGERTLHVGGRQLDLVLVSAGNPHAVTFLDVISFNAVEKGEATQLGPLVEKDPAFPRGVNVGFAHVSSLYRDPRVSREVKTMADMDLIVWERGAGLTLACGTGACAAVAAASAKGLFEPAARCSVRLPGGPLEVTIASGGRATMRGPARHVFSGHWVGGA